jgi:hypothetical protein
VGQIFNPISWFDSLFDFLFGGGGHQQVVVPRKLRHRPHIIFAQYSGLSSDLIVAQNNGAGCASGDGATTGVIIGGVAAGEAIGETALGATAWEAAIGAAAAVGIYEAGKYLFAHRESNKGYRCVLVAEVPGPRGITCVYRCKGYGALATFPKPAGMASCPKGFDKWFPGP